VNVSDAWDIFFFFGNRKSKFYINRIRIHAGNQTINQKWRQVAKTPKTIDRMNTKNFYFLGFGCGCCGGTNGRFPACSEPRMLPPPNRSGVPLIIPDESPIGFGGFFI
jgi:hypothetical protein